MVARMDDPYTREVVLLALGLLVLGLIVILLMVVGEIELQRFHGG